MSTNETEHMIPEPLFLDGERDVKVFEQRSILNSVVLNVSKNAFEDVLLSELPNHYSEVDCSFTETLLSTAAQKDDPNGYFTQSKRVFWLFSGKFPVGFTVVSLKRGGSAKIGPTGVVESYRRQGFGTLLRDVVETFLEQKVGCRKLYMTVATTNIPALLFNLGRGYKVEAILREQYQSGSDEVVLGKFRGEVNNQSHEREDSAASAVSAGPHVQAHLLVDPSRVDVEELLEHRMAGFYDDIDRAYYEAIAEACSDLRQSYAKKGKQVFVAKRGDSTTGVAVYVPKRGGASKLSPLMADDGESLAVLISRIEAYAVQTDRRKLYAHVPLPRLESIRWLLEQNYIIEGILREPYSEGINFAVMGKQL